MVGGGQPRPITEITPAEILDLLKRVEKSGRRETARKLRSNIGSVFRLAIATLRATNDPTYPLRGALLKPTLTVAKYDSAIGYLLNFGGLNHWNLRTDDLTAQSDDCLAFLADLLR